MTSVTFFNFGKDGNIGFTKNELEIMTKRETSL